MKNPAAIALLACVFSIAGLWAQSPLSSPPVSASQSPSPSAGVGGAVPSPSLSPGADSDSIKKFLENPQVIQILKEKAIIVHISIKMMNGKDVVWSSEQTRATVHGSAVSLKLESSNFLILSEITPYKIDANKLLIMVQGQIWLQKDSRLRLLPSLKSTEVGWDEPLYFYPFGKDNGDNQSNLIMEISVSRYQDKDSKQ